MARAIRQIGLTLLSAFNRLFGPKPGPGWRRSLRCATDLRGK
jgi:hypothetical protein